MKIAFVLPLYWPIVGGCELHTHELVLRLSERHEVRVLTLMSRQKDKVRADDFWFACMLSAPATAKHYRDHEALVTNIGLRRWEKILFFPFLRVQGPRVSRVARRLAMTILVAFYRRKLHTELTDCDLIHAIHGDVAWISKAALLEARVRQIPFVFTPVTHLFQSSSSPRSGDQAAEVRIDKLEMRARGALTETWLETCRGADALVAMTSFEQRFFIDQHINARAFALGVAPIVAAGIKGNFRAQHGLGDYPLVLFLGRNNPDKGVPEILAATPEVWRRHPHTRFVFVGPPEWGIERHFEAHADPRILVLGTLDIQQKSEALAACDLLCVPSVVESLGGIYLEAWYYGKPIIGADIPPIRDLSENGRGGILVRPAPDAIAEAINVLLDDPELRRMLGAWGRARVQQKYNWDRISEQLEWIYQGLLNEP